MAHEEAMKVISAPSASDLSAKQYFIVKLDSNGKIALCGTGDRPIGILQDVPNAAGRVGRICVSGVSKCVFGGAVTPGGVVSADSAGKGIAPGSADDYILGALVGTVTTSSGEVHSVLVQPLGTT